MFDADSLALLFARHVSPYPCRCSAPGYCPEHGTYQPVGDDPEVTAVLQDAGRRTGGIRVIRKRLDD